MRGFLYGRNSEKSPKKAKILSNPSPYFIYLCGERLRGWRCGGGGEDDGVLATNMEEVTRMKLAVSVHKIAAAEAAALNASDDNCALSTLFV